MPPDDRQIEQYYDDYERIEDEFQADLDVSLAPRGLDHLYEIVRGLALPAGATVLDLGCGDGRDSIRLAREFGFPVLGVDPIAHHIDVANKDLQQAAEEDARL